MNSNIPVSSRRNFLKKTGFATALYMTPSLLVNAVPVMNVSPHPVPKEQLSLLINGKEYSLMVDARTSLLDLLREQLGLTGTKKGCDMGQCGACMVHVNGKKVNACLSLAIDQEGMQVTTIEGLAREEQLHPLQAAFIRHDSFQCGYCTSGQIMSGIACIREGKAVSKESIREYMEGNICRCGAYQNIVNAIHEVAQSGTGI
jgi:xanthine dehydrogenase YagT iron-sulfur-binding subunit